MSSSLTSKINFFFKDSKPSLKNRQRLKSFIYSIFKREGKKLDTISFIFTNDRTIHIMNRRYLNHDFLTDIIAFELSGNKDPIMAEIYISYDRVRENAIIHKARIQQELHRVIFHGVLHLCGYKDKTELQKRDIRRKEDAYLSKYLGHVSRDTLATGK